MPLMLHLSCMLFVLRLYVTPKNLITDYCEPLSLSNGGVAYSTFANGGGNYESGTTATHSCSEGFSLEGAQTRTCMDGMDGSGQGSWSGMAPTCERKIYLEAFISQ